MNLSGKTAVITGSTSGIGLGIARKLAEAGADIVLNSFTSKPEDHQLANALAREFSVEARYCSADIKPTINDVAPDLIESSPKSGPTVRSSTTIKGVGKAPDLSSKAKSVAS